MYKGVFCSRKIESFIEQLKREKESVKENLFETAIIEKLELDFFKSKYTEQLQEFLKTWDDDEEVIFWEYEEGEGGRFCYKDSEHDGCVYVPKRCILADPSFYKISEWEDATDEELKDVKLSDYKHLYTTEKKRKSSSTSSSSSSSKTKIMKKIKKKSNKTQKVNESIDDSAGEEEEDITATDDSYDNFFGFKKIH